MRVSPPRGDVMGGEEAAGGSRRRVAAALMVSVLTSLVLVPAALTTPAEAELRPTIHQTLPNGMELVMIEDHSSPLVAECLWVGVGAVDETPATGGLSHFLEHLLFDGTADHSREELQREFERRGIYYNAFTRKEYTAHILTAPAEYLRDALSLQADMLLRSTIPPEELEKERKVVIEEMTRDRDNPHYYSEELFERELFRGAPLAQPVLGFESTISTIPREEVLAFYQRYYAPDRMVAIVVGDFDPREVKEIFGELYGEAPPSSAGPVTGFSPPPTTASSPLSSRRYREESLPVRSSLLRLGFHAPHAAGDEAPPFELASHLLVGEENSRLTERLTGGPEPLASSVEGAYRMHRGGSVWTVTVTLEDAEEAAVVEEAITEEIRLLAAVGPGPEELERAKISFRVNEAFDTEHFLFFAMDLSYWMGRGGYEARRDFYRELEGVTAEDVRAVATRYLAPMNCLVHLTRPPAGREEGAAPVPRPQTEKRVLENGLTLIVRENPRSQVTAIHTLVGHRAELEPPGLEGIGNLACEMLTEGTATRGREEITLELAEMGVRLAVAENPMIPYDNYYWTPDYAFARLEVINEFGGEAIRLLTDLLRNPSCPPERLEPSRQKLLGLVAREAASASTVGGNLLREGLFGEGIWAHPIRGTAESLTRITRAELLAYHKMAFAPNNLIIAVAGGMPREEAFAALEDGWRHAAAVELSLPPAPDPTGAPPDRRRLMQEMDREQTYLALGHRVVGFSHDDMPALTLLGAVLSRRLGLELREKQGLAYSVGAGADYTRDFGWFYLSMGTRGQNVEQALAGMESEMAVLRDSLVTAEELEIVVNSTWARRLRYRQRHINQAYYLGVHEYLGRGYDFEEREKDLLSAVSPEDLRRVARAYLGPAGWVTVEVGRAREAREEGS